MSQSKKVQKHRKAEITLEPDGFSIHTFELSMKLSKSEWKECKQKLYAEQEESGEHWIYQDKQSGHYFCTRYAAAGIRIRLEHNDTGKGESTHFIRMIVNPRKLIYPQSEYLGILPPEEDSVELLEKAFRHLFRKTPFENNMRRYYLSRVDLCTNIRCDRKNVFRELVRLLRKTAAPKKYERKLYQHKNKKKANQYNKHYIRIACGSQELVIYDKTYQMEENNLVVDYEGLHEGVLRIEVHYGRDKLHSIEKHAETDDPLDILWQLMQESRQRILELVEKCYPPLEYLSFDDAREKITQSRFKSRTQKRMLTLLEQMQRKQTIDAALNWMKKQDMQTKDLLEKFGELGINPIPLRKGYAASRMPSLTEILSTVGEGKISIDLTEWKWK